MFTPCYGIFSSVSQSVVSDFLRPHDTQLSRPPCPSPTPRVYPNSRPLSWWCHPTISSSVVPFFSCPQSFPASGSFQMSQLFTSGGQSIGVSASTSVLPVHTHNWSPLGWPGWISLQYKGFSRVLFNTAVQKHQFFGTQLSLLSNSYPYMTSGKTIALTRRTFVSKVMSLLFNTLSRLVIAAITICSDFGAQKDCFSLFPLFPIYLPWSDGTRCHDLSFLNVEF